jgi:hypothetical protein
MSIIPATREGIGKRISNSRPAWAKRKNPSQPTSWIWWYTSVSSATRGTGRIVVQTSPGINARPYLKNN